MPRIRLFVDRIIHTGFACSGDIRDGDYYQFPVTGDARIRLSKRVFELLEQNCKDHYGVLSFPDPSRIEIIYEPPDLAPQVDYDGNIHVAFHYLRPYFDAVVPIRDSGDADPAARAIAALRALPPPEQFKSKFSSRQKSTQTMAGW